MNELLPPCPRSPNCVSSQAEDARRRVEPLAYRGSAAAALDALLRALRSLPRVTVTAESPGLLRAEARTRFGFVDDLALALHPDPGDDGGLVHVRSASRLGWHDLGANRRRVERLRAAFADECASGGIE